MSCNFSVFLNNSKNKLKDIPIERYIFERKFPKEINVFREAYGKKHPSLIKNLSKKEYRKFINFILN